MRRLHGAHGPIDELADLRDQDAVELAMERPRATQIKFELLDAMAQEYPMPKAAAADRAHGGAGSGCPRPRLAPFRHLETNFRPRAGTVCAAEPAGCRPDSVGEVPLPRTAPGAPPPSPAQLLHLDDKGYAKAERCLFTRIYFESRSEPVRGQEPSPRS